MEGAAAGENGRRRQADQRPTGEERRKRAHSVVARIRIDRHGHGRIADDEVHVRGRDRIAVLVEHAAGARNTHDVQLAPLRVGQRFERASDVVEHRRVRIIAPPRGLTDDPAWRDLPRAVIDDLRACLTNMRRADQITRETADDTVTNAFDTLLACNAVRYADYVETAASRAARDAG